MDIAMSPARRSFLIRKRMQALHPSSMYGKINKNGGKRQQPWLKLYTVKEMGDGNSISSPSFLTALSTLPVLRGERKTGESSGMEFDLVPFDINDKNNEDDIESALFPDTRSTSITERRRLNNLERTVALQKKRYYEERKLLGGG